MPCRHLLSRLVLVGVLLGSVAPHASVAYAQPAAPAQPQPAQTRLVQAQPPQTGETADEEAPATFSYTRPTQKNYVRGLLELGGVWSLGFLQYVTERDVVRHYDVAYSWPIFRRKLLGQALSLDTNQLGTNFVGHPIGGTGYYFAARGNHLNIAESLALSAGASFFWELFGEVNEIISINDVLVTPLAGMSIGESMIQLGTFFDRSRPNWHNRLLSVVFSPIKSLNDLLDGQTLVRAERFDQYGFPADEWHQFDLSASLATTRQASSAQGESANLSHDWRLSLSSQLAHLPDYDGAGRHSIVFSEGNFSTIDAHTAFVMGGGLADLDFATQVMALGYYHRDAHNDEHGKLWGQGTLFGMTSGYQLTFHNYDRDGLRQLDQISTIEPVALLLEQRGAFGTGRAFVRLSAGGDFGGVRPYALRGYYARSDTVKLPYVLEQHSYYFGLGARVLASAGISWGVIELLTRLRVEGYSALEMPVPIGDRLTALQARLGCAIPSTPVRLSAYGEQRTRWGEMGGAHASRSELSAGFEIGARY